MYNSIRNGSGLINNRLVKNRKTANLISNLNINNLNNEKINDDNKKYKKDINNSKNELSHTRIVDFQYNCIPFVYRLYPL